MECTTKRSMGTSCGRASKFGLGMCAAWRHQPLDHSGVSDSLIGLRAAVLIGAVNALRTLDHIFPVSVKAAMAASGHFPDSGGSWRFRRDWTLLLFGRDAMAAPPVVSQASHHRHQQPFDQEAHALLNTTSRTNREPT